MNAGSESKLKAILERMFQIKRSFVECYQNYVRSLELFAKFINENRTREERILLCDYFLENYFYGGFAKMRRVVSKLKELAEKGKWNDKYARWIRRQVEAWIKRFMYFYELILSKVPKGFMLCGRHLDGMQHPFKHGILVWETIFSRVTSLTRYEENFYSFFDYVFTPFKGTTKETIFLVWPERWYRHSIMAEVLFNTAIAFDKKEGWIPNYFIIGGFDADTFKLHLNKYFDVDRFKRDLKLIIYETRDVERRKSAQILLTRYVYW